MAVAAKNLGILGVQALELVRVAFMCARVGGDLGSVLVLHDAKFDSERVLLAHVGAGGGHITKACVHAIEFMWFWNGFG